MSKKQEKPRNRKNKQLNPFLFLTNGLPSDRNGKVVYIRPEYHERLLLNMQLAREEKITFYSYNDNIPEYDFREFGDDISESFNERFKSIL